MTDKKIDPPAPSQELPKSPKVEIVTGIVEDRAALHDELLSVVKDFYGAYPIESPVNPQLTDAYHDAEKVLEKEGIREEAREKLRHVTPAAPAATPKEKEENDAAKAGKK